MNVDRSLVGGRSLPVPLSDPGRRAAWDLGVAYRRRGFRPDAVYCTSAVRSRETAELVAASAGWQVPIQVEDGLIELSQGEAEGQPRSLWWIPSAIAEMEADPLNHRLAPRGESHLEVQRRAIAAVQRLARRHPNERVWVVSHGITMRTLAWALHGGSHGFFQTLDLPNLGRYTLHVDPHTLAIDLLDPAPGVPLGSDVFQALA